MATRAKNKTVTHNVIKPDQITLSDLYHALTLSQIVALISLFVAVISGAYAIGIFTETKRNEISDIAQAKLLADEQAQSRSLKTDLQYTKTEVSALNQRLVDKKANIEEITKIIRRLEFQARGNEGEIEFLTRFISYSRSPSDASKSTFVDYVCALWREAQNQRIHFDREPLTSFNLSLDPAISSELRDILINSGVSQETISNAVKSERRVVRVGPLITREQTDDDVISAKSQINRIIKSATLAKIIKFPDGRSFEVPPEIAIIVHTKPNCSPV